MGFKGCKNTIFNTILHRLLSIGFLAESEGNILKNRRVISFFTKEKSLTFTASGERICQ